MAFAFLLLIPLQGLAAWRALDWAGAVESRGTRQELQRIAQFRQAVTSAGGVAALQANLAAIQAPALGPEDLRQSLAAIKSGLLAQLQAAEQRARATAAPGTATGQGLNPARLVALGKESLRVVLLSLGLALGFAAAAQRQGRELSQRAEWEQALEGVLEAGLLWQQERLARQDEKHWQLEQQHVHELELAAEMAAAEEAMAEPLKECQVWPDSPLVAGEGGRNRGHCGADAAYFEALAGQQGEPAGD